MHNPAYTVRTEIYNRDKLVSVPLGARFVPPRHLDDPIPAQAIPQPEAMLHAITFLINVFKIFRELAY